jgi:ABC-type Fe3+-hydroxamate transport system substrate-binding protein
MQGRTARTRAAVDDTGREVCVPAIVSRAVSVVPSLTQTVAECAPGLLVGATNWCSHPPDLAVTRVGGTKNPDVPKIIALRPDVVLANEEENRETDLAAMREAGLAVWVTKIRDLPGAIDSLRRMIMLACARPEPDWLGDAEAAWQRVRAGPERAAVVPVWRRPWMVLGSDTFAGDLLARLGIANLYAANPERYPRVDVSDLRNAGAGLVVLPDEPYAFSASDGPEAFPGMPTALVSGRHLTWYGPSLTEAPAVLSAQLAAAKVRCT